MSHCQLSNTKSQNITVDFALKDHVAAFRYYFPEDANITARTIISENSTFNIPKSAGDYQLCQPYDAPVPKYQTFYQPRDVREKASIGSQTGAGNSSTDYGFAYPCLFKTATQNGSPLWIALKETGFDGRYPASHIANISSEGTVSLAFPPEADANGNFGIPSPRSILPWNTPWRVIVTSKSVNHLVDDTSVNDLASPTAEYDVDWIKPGPASWSWWSNGTSPTSYEELRKFIDLASDLGWPYSLLDAKWERNFDSKGVPVYLEQLTQYAASKNVKLWLWMNSAGPNNNATDTTPRNLLYDPRTRRETMKRLAKLGIAGLKVDGIQSDRQEMMQYLIDILEDAAKYKVMILFHNCPLPHGWERTYPHLIGIEALIASEYYTNTKIAYGDQVPENNVNEAFVRFNLGSADYSPGSFVTTQKVDPIHTTYAHETALNVIVNSGLRVLPDTPKTYLSVLPRELTDFLGSIPFFWDHSRFVAGEPGKYFVYSRQSGPDLYLAGINGETTSISTSTNISHPTYKPPTGAAREVCVDLAEAFQTTREALCKSTNILSVTDVAGGNNRTADITKQFSLTNNDTLCLHMEPFGGFALHFRL